MTSGGSSPRDLELVPLVGNKAIEQAAIAFVMDLERAAGRDPIDRRFVAAFAAESRVRRA